MAVNTAQATEQELDAFSDALEHPPQKPDLITTLLTCVSGSFLSVKILGDAARDASGAFVMKPTELAYIILGFLFVVGSLVRYTVLYRLKNPFHERALKYAKTLMAIAKNESS